ncbi:MAG: IS200/IS605 family transposase [Methylobacteriaceae bacterium]|nr:IS200/IS605 family transposase [Methylobacteriaceae bacterium]
MPSYNQILYHIVFRTKASECVIPQEHERELYAYILGVIKGRNCKLHRIGGMEEHIHILSDLHPSVSLADYIKEIKTASTRWMKQSGKFPYFNGWGTGYCALTYSIKERKAVYEYIKNQRQHHTKESFRDEIRRLFIDNDIQGDEKWFWKDE